MRAETGVSVQSILQFAGRHVRTRGRFAIALLALSNQLGFAALAAAPSMATQPSLTVCSHAIGAAQHCGPTSSGDLQLGLPQGTQQCPDSGAGAACETNNGSARPAPGVASTPDATSPCPVTNGLALPSSLASCSNVILAPAIADLVSNRVTVGAPLTFPSVPASTLQVSPPQRIELAADRTTAQPGQRVVITATTSNPLDAAVALEIFDMSTGSLIGACTQSTQCAVAYAAPSAVHRFVAYVTPPTSIVPGAGAAISSNSISVSWIAVQLSASTSIVGAKKPATLTTTSTVPVDGSGWLLQLYDVDTKARLSYCSHGTRCSVSIAQGGGGAHTFVAALAPPSATFPSADSVVAQSDLFSVTWLSIAVEATTTNPHAGGSVIVRATTNADLAGTAWSLAILDDQGTLVGSACKTGSTCVVNYTLASDKLPSFSAAVGTVEIAKSASRLNQVLRKVAPSETLAGVEAQSGHVGVAIRPSGTLWGVDSCKAFTTDGSGAGDLYSQVASTLGAPDFWGRYLTWTACAGLSPTEIQAASRNHMGILPIYDDYNCSDVSGYDTGKTYAGLASQAAGSLGVPTGRALVIDIEPPGDACPGAANVDAGFIQGWYDGLAANGYVAAYYGNGTGGSEFASAWCSAVAANPAIAVNSYVWSFESSFQGNFTKATAPAYGPLVTGCPGHASGWQYALSSGSNPDVDQDEAAADLPIWFP